MTRHMIIIALLATSSIVTHAGDHPGLVSEKPAAGRFVEVDAGYMVPYQMTLPGTDVSFWMEPIPGGEFLMGSPATEAGHHELEGPQRRFKVAPFWMARHEVTWGEYSKFTDLYDYFKSFQEEGIRAVSDENKVDAITAPTPLYEPEFTFEYGEDDQQPAITVTQYSAKQYSKWLSLASGLQFRLPTEAEWEYACRAGTTTAYHFGDDPAKLTEFAWFAENSADEGSRKVGQKKPNQWGLYDMHGNAAEWVLDSYEKYKASDNSLDAAHDWVSTANLDPRTVRGGSWEFEAAQCRSAARLGSDSELWREYDPNLPKSPWWFTTDPARGVGFRLIQPLKAQSREAMEVFWKIDNEDTQYDVDDRLAEGRGVMGLIDQDLPAAIQKLNE